MSEYLQAAVQRVLAGSRDEADLMAIATAIQMGQFTWASSKGSVGVGGDVVNSLIVPGSYNIIDSTIVLEGEAAIAIQTLLTQRLGVAPTVAMPLDKLLRQVRSRASAKILNLFSQIQLLNKRQVAVDQLYVDVYVLEVRDFRATIPGLLEGQDARKQFDRFGLGTRGERSPGLAIAASEDYPRLMVLGKPGSGKSTFLRHLAVSCAKGEFLGDYIPVLLELRDVDEAAFSLFQYLHGEFGLEQEVQTEQILKQGRVLFLLDGLDEVPSSLRQRVQHELRKFTKQYDKNRFILTCRTQTTEYIPEQFQAVEVADFKPEQVECFALHWFTAMAGTSEQGMALKNHFMEKLRESPQTAELAVTPVLLSLTCWIFDDLKCLPEKRSDLYRDGLDLLLKQWDEGRGISRDSGGDRYHQLTTEERKQLLSYVAVRKFEQVENFVLYEELELCGYIAEYLQVSVEESRAVLRAIAQQHGLLIERAQGIWSFSHLTFQEYLVAKWFCDRSDWITLANRMAEKRWREVILLAIEMMQSIDEFLITVNQEIVNLLASDLNLQDFLDWISQKVTSSESSYKPAAIRAVYFCRLLDIDLETERDLYKVMTDPYKFNDDLTLDLQFLFDQDFAMIIAHNLDQTHTCGTGLSFIPRITAVLNLSIPSQLLPMYGLNLAFSLSPELRIKLENIKAQLPNAEESSERLKQWWNENGKKWLEQLRTLMIEYRNIGYKFELSEQQKAALRQYYDANLMLLDCLNSSHEVSNKVRIEIEESLFLPIAEIKKRKKQSSN